MEWFKWPSKCEALSSSLSAAKKKKKKKREEKKTGGRRDWAPKMSHRKERGGFYKILGSAGISDW
jgi:hypothetical protein